MSEKTGIEWTDHTFNPWIGRSKVSPGCKNCYAETLDQRYYGGTHWGKGAPRKRTSESTWRNPVKWNAIALTNIEAHPDYAHVRPRIFPSLCDWLDDEAPIEWLADFLKLIHDTPNLDWLLLTKRPENLWRCRETLIGMKECSADFETWLMQWSDGFPPSNVWIGVSVEDQKRADERIPQLLQIPAKVRFLSVEPLLSPIEFGAVPGGLVSPIYQNRNSKVDWVIVGGESGPDRRDCGVDAICDVARQCVAAGVPCFVKQDSAFKPGQQGRIPDDIWKLKQFP